MQTTMYKEVILSSKHQEQESTNLLLWVYDLWVHDFILVLCIFWKNSRSVKMISTLKKTFYENQIYPYYKFIQQIKIRYSDDRLCSMDRLLASLGILFFLIYKTPNQHFFFFQFYFFISFYVGGLRWVIQQSTLKLGVKGIEIVSVDDQRFHSSPGPFCFSTSP
jgi:hypothetical protein